MDGMDRLSRIITLLSSSIPSIKNASIPSILSIPSLSITEKSSSNNKNLADSGMWIERILS